MSTFPIPGLEAVAPRRTPSTESLLDGLNEPQRAAVVHAGPPLLVVAGAGSGKTRVLTRRIAWLIQERKAHPGSILAITFTNKAAAEMKERVEDLVGKRARIMWVSTFHSACVRILRKEIDKVGFKSSFSIYDAADSKRLMTLVCQDLDLDPKRYQPRAVLNWVSNAKNELKDPEDAKKDTRNSFEEAYAAAYELYQRRLRDANALDFDDLIMTTVHLFQAFPEVRETYRRRFRHVLVDEYQDTNHAQYAFIHQLCADSDGGDRGRRRAGRAGRADGGRRRRPVDLRLPRRQHPQHPRLRAGLPQRHLDPPRAELPLHPDHPQRRQLGHRQQQGPQAQAAVEPGRRRRQDRRVRRRRRARRGPVRLRGDRQAHRRGRGPGRRRRGVLPHQRPVAGVRGGVHPHRPALQGGRRGALLRAPRGPRRAGLPPDAGQPRRRDLAAPGAQRAQARHRRPRRGLCRGVRRARADHLLGGAAPRRRGARASRPARSRPSRASWRWSRSCSRWSTRGSGPTSCSSRCWSAPATSPSSRPPTTRRTRPGSRTSPSSWPWPASSPTTRSPARRPTPPTSTPAPSRRASPTSWSGWRWSPTPTRSPTSPTRTTPGWSR